MKSLKEPLKLKELLKKNESALVDYKAVCLAFTSTDNLHSKHKAELIKDVCAMLNNHSPSYLILGVTNDKKIVGIQAKFEEADFQQLIRANIKPESDIKVENYKEKTVKDEEVDVIVINICGKQHAHYVTKDIHILTGSKTKINPANLVYIRSGSSTSIATPLQIKKLESKQVKPKLLRTFRLSDSVADLKEGEELCKIVRDNSLATISDAGIIIQHTENKTQLWSNLALVTCGPFMKELEKGKNYEVIFNITMLALEKNKEILHCDVFEKTATRELRGEVYKPIITERVISSQVVLANTKTKKVKLAFTPEHSGSSLEFRIWAYCGRIYLGTSDYTLVDNLNCVKNLLARNIQICQIL